MDAVLFLGGSFLCLAVWQSLRRLQMPSACMGMMLAQAWPPVKPDIAWAPRLPTSTGGGSVQMDGGIDSETTSCRAARHPGNMVAFA
jgi:hypothetical protein